MGSYDSTLKQVLTELTAPAFRHITHASEPVLRWENVELPGLQIPRVDLLGQTAGGGLIHLELQSTNDRGMAVRMLEYALAIRRVHNRFPDQAVLYVGRQPMRMPDRVEIPGISFRYRLIDIAAIDGAALLESPGLAENVIAILTRLGDDPRAALRRILERIAVSEPRTRDRALKDLGALSGLRELGPLLEEEVKSMPIREEDFPGPNLFAARIQEIAVGMIQSREAGERDILRRQLQKRFNAVPDWAEVRLNSLSGEALEEAALRILDAATIEDVLQ
jgi:hypothetical protein